MKRFLLITFTVMLFFSSCSNDLVTMKLRDKKLKVEIVRSEEERNKGLMFRERLPKNQGMFFVFDKPQILSFWMKNTSIPLHIAYISDDGTIREIHTLTPYSTRGVSSVHRAKYALEVNRGTFKRLGIKEGDKVKVPGFIPAE